MENSLDCDNINNYLNTNNQRRLSTYPLDSMALRGGPPDDSDDDDNGSIDNKRDTKIDMPPPPPPNYNTVHGEKFADKRVKVRVLIFVIILSSFVFILFAIFFIFSVIIFLLYLLGVLKKEYLKGRFSNYILSKTLCKYIFISLVNV